MLEVARAEKTSNLFRGKSHILQVSAYQVKSVYIIQCVSNLLLV